MNLRTTGLFVVQTNMPQKYFYIQTDLLFGAEYKVFEGFFTGKGERGKKWPLHFGIQLSFHHYEFNVSLR